MQEQSYYNILGVSRNASDQDIRRAYLKSAAIYHPDKYQKDDDKQRAHDMFIQIGKAYEILSNENKKYGYDLYREKRNNKRDDKKEEDKENNKDDEIFDDFSNIFSDDLSSANVKDHFKSPFQNQKSKIFEHFNKLFKNHEDVFHNNAQCKNKTSTAVSNFIISSTKTIVKKNNYTIEKTVTVDDMGCEITTIRKKIRKSIR